MRAAEEHSRIQMVGNKLRNKNWKDFFKYKKVHEMYEMYEDCKEKSTHKRVMELACCWKGGQETCFYMAILMMISEFLCINY